MAVVSRIQTTDGVIHEIAASELTYTNYGVCSSSSGTVAKTVTVNNDNFVLSVGVKVRVKFNSTNVAESPTLAVNGTAAKPIVTRGTDSAGKGSASSWIKGSVVELTYDGTSWVIDGWLNDNDVYHAGGSNVTVEDLDPFEEYDSLNSIYNSSSTSFSTALIPANQNEVFIDIRYYERSSLTSFYLFGFAGGANANYRYGIVQPTNTSSAKFHLCWRDKNNAYLESRVARVASHIYRIKARLHNGTATLYVLDETTGVSDTVTATYDTTNVNILSSYIRLFAGGSSSYYCGSGTYVYSAKMDCDGKPMLNYIPMRRKSDSMVGFLDTVSGSFLSSDSGNVGANKLNVGSYLDRPDNHIIKVSSTVDDSNFVHKTGYETVGGEKTFTDNVNLGPNSKFVFDVGNDESVYIAASTDSNGGKLTFGDGETGNEVRLANVATPIDPLDAVNKAYVDLAIAGGSSGITLPLAITEGGTGRTTAKGAEFAVTPKLASELSTDIEDSYRIPFLSSSASATNGRFAGWRKASRIWDYILGKTTSLLGISYDSNDEGVPLAPTAAFGTNNTQIATTAFVQNEISGLAVDDSVVHKAVAEEITGDKTFKGANVILQNIGSSSAATPNLVFQRGNDADSYIDWLIGSNSSGRLVVSSRSSGIETVRMQLIGSSSTQQMLSSIDIQAPKFITDGGTAQQYVTGNGTLGGNATQSAAGLLSATDKTKLDGIATGAEANVQSDWNQTDNSADDFIKNKPTITTYNVFQVGSETTPPTAGINGLVPAPFYSERRKFLRGDGTWQTPDNPTPLKLNGKTLDYALFQKSLVVCSIANNGRDWFMSPICTSGGTGTKTPNYNARFAIGSTIYYHADNTAYPAGTAFCEKTFYTSYENVDARYFAVNVQPLELASESKSDVYLRVFVSEGYWWPYYKSGNTVEIIVTPKDFVTGDFYIYLGKTSSSNNYTFQLEENHPLYYYDGTQLVDYATWIASQNTVTIQDPRIVSGTTYGMTGYSNGTNFNMEFAIPPDFYTTPQSRYTSAFFDMHATLRNIGSATTVEYWLEVGYYENGTYVTNEVLASGQTYFPRGSSISPIINTISITGALKELTSETTHVRAHFESSTAIDLLSTTTTNSKQYASVIRLQAFVPV